MKEQAEDWMGEPAED
jgi:hypothetical protein